MALLDSKQLNPRLTGSFTLSGSLSGDSASTGSFGYLNVAGNSNLVGDLTLGGNIQIGDSSGDSITITADLTSNLTPNADSTYDLGTTAKNWRVGYIEQLIGTTVTTTGNIVSTDGNISGSASSTGSFGEVVAARNATIGNDIVAGNRVTAEYGTVNYSLVVNEGGHGGGDFRVESDTNPYMIWSDANMNRVSIGSVTSAGGSTFGVTGDITATSHITASGNISGSLTSTGSFGTIQTTTGTIPTLIGNTTFRDNLTVAGNLDVADTIYHTGDSNTKIRFPEVDTISFHTSGNERLRIDASGHITASGHISSSATSTGSFGRIESANDIYSYGNITTEGDLTAQRYIVSSSVTYMTTSFSSGSTVFGDDSDDNHRFTGSLRVTGSLNVDKGRIFEQGTSVIDHATAMAIVFGG
jgi:hypothetical protein